VESAAAAALAAVIPLGITALPGALLGPLGFDAGVLAGAAEADAVEEAAREGCAGVL
jgi:hypothetical protein